MNKVKIVTEAYQDDSFQLMADQKAKRVRSRFERRMLLFDGAMGTELYRNHIFTNCCFEDLNRARSDLIRRIHRSYLNAGAEVLTTNTFGANRLNLEKYGLADRTDEINRAGVDAARSVAEEVPDADFLVAGSVGPLPVLAYSEGNCAVLTEQLSSLIAAGVDFILFETLPSRALFEAAAQAMEVFAPFPFILSGTVMRIYDETRGNLKDSQELSDWFSPLPETSPAPVAYGLNCGLGPAEMLEAAQAIMPYLNLPLVVQPNAGRPKEFEGRQLYYCSPEYISTYAMEYAKLGVRAVGGCCGTGPEHIAEVGKMLKPWLRNETVAISSIDTPKKAQPQPESEFATRSRLAQKLSQRQWIRAVELTPPRGWDLGATLEKVRRLAAFGIDAVNLPDGPRASSRVSSTAVAKRILELNEPIEPILHFCCRDRNLIGMQADLLGCAALGIRNILFITGDPPKLGNYPNATGVFDTDAIGLCSLQKNLNQGIDLGGEPLNEPTGAVFGVGLDPTSPDLHREKEKFFRKIEAGAAFAITQPVFDADALLRFLDQCGEIPIPIIAGVWPLASYKNALFMRNEVPGVHLPDTVLARMMSASEKSKEDQIAEGVAIAREIIVSIRDRVGGVQVSAPFGKIEISMAVLE